MNEDIAVQSDDSSAHVSQGEEFSSTDKIQDLLVLVNRKTEPTQPQDADVEMVEISVNATTEPNEKNSVEKFALEEVIRSKSTPALLKTVSQKAPSDTKFDICLVFPINQKQNKETDPPETYLTEEGLKIVDKIKNKFDPDNVQILLGPNRAGVQLKQVFVSFRASPALLRKTAVDKSVYLLMNEDELEERAIRGWPEHGIKGIVKPQLEGKAKKKRRQ